MDARLEKFGGCNQQPSNQQPKTKKCPVLLASFPDHSIRSVYETLFHFFIFFCFHTCVFRTAGRSTLRTKVVIQHPHIADNGRRHRCVFLLGLSEVYGDSGALKRLHTPWRCISTRLLLRYGLTWSQRIYLTPSFPVSVVSEAVAF